jgi:translation elongation factor P/translation initiation factor 5A
MHASDIQPASGLFLHDEPWLVLEVRQQTGDGSPGIALILLNVLTGGKWAARWAPGETVGSSFTFERMRATLDSVDGFIHRFWDAVGHKMYELPADQVFTEVAQDDDRIFELLHYEGNVVGAAVPEPGR